MLLPARFNRRSYRLVSFHSDKLKQLPNKAIDFILYHVHALYVSCHIWCLIFYIYSQIVECVKTLYKVF